MPSNTRVYSHCVSFHIHAVLTIDCNKIHSNRCSYNSNYWQLKLSIVIELACAGKSVLHCVIQHFLLHLLKREEVSSFAFFHYLYSSCCVIIIICSIKVKYNKRDKICVISLEIRLIFIYFSLLSKPISNHIEIQIFWWT